MKKVVAIVQSRLGSSRLPGKALALISGQRMLGHVLTRARAIRGIDAVVLATSDQDRDTPLTWVAREQGIEVVRGRCAEHDVLTRFEQAARAHDADIIMRLTGDCPLLDPSVCQRVLDMHREMPDVEYVSNDTTVSGYPDGLDVEVFTARLLYAASRTVPEHAAWVHGDREHVTSFMRRTQPQVVLHCPTDWRHLKLSVDTADDLARVRMIYSQLSNGDYTLDATLAAARRAGVST